MKALKEVERDASECTWISKSRRWISAKGAKTVSNVTISTLSTAGSEECGRSALPGSWCVWTPSLPCLVFVLEPAAPPLCSVLVIGKAWPVVRLQALVLKFVVPELGPSAACQIEKLLVSTMLIAICWYARATEAGCGSTRTMCMGRR